MNTKIASRHPDLRRNRYYRKRCGRKGGPIALRNSLSSAGGNVGGSPRSGVLNSTGAIFQCVTKRDEESRQMNREHPGRNWRKRIILSKSPWVCRILSKSNKIAEIPFFSELSKMREIMYLVEGGRPSRTIQQWRIILMSAGRMGVLGPLGHPSYNDD